jgi:DNA topoisomerase-1
MIAFGTMLAVVRRRVEHDLGCRGLPREKVLATVVRLLETTFVRVGNEEYAKENDSFGVTTMRDRHVRIAGSKLTFRFRGKSGVLHTVELTDSRLARIVRECQDLPGYELFQYVDKTGEVCRLDSSDVNRHIREISGQDFTAKDFRTWADTVLAACNLYGAGPSNSATQSRKAVVEATRSVARHLRNRPATCRKYYIHPAIPGFLPGRLSLCGHARRRAAEFGLRRIGAAAGRVFRDGPGRGISAEAGQGRLNTGTGLLACAVPAAWRQ